MHLACLALATACTAEPPRAADRGAPRADAALADGGASAPGDSSVADGAPLSQGEVCIAEPGRVIPTGMVYSDGCNQCWCNGPGLSPRCDGGVCLATCTAASCSCPGADAGAAECPPLRCRAQGDCAGRQPCLFDPGCDDPVGYCVNTQPTCGYADQPNVVATSSSSQTFCGCDGVTYEGSCAKVPYRHAGPCE